MKRLFLVGCPRSGTTLLQSLLASHPEIASFPESEFFNHLFPHSEPKRKKLGLISRRAKPQLAKFLRESSYQEHVPSPLCLFPHQLTSHFISALDDIAKRQNKTIWIEKTPTHLYELDYIAQRVPTAKFIHIIRAGSDTIASLYDVRQKYPKQWKNEPASVELSTSRWLRDVSISLDCAALPNHTLVSYEALVKDPRQVLQQLCKFVGTDFTVDMLSSRAATAQQVSLEREPWKAGAAAPIQNANSTKFHSLFTPEQQAYILERIAAVDLSIA